MSLSPTLGARNLAGLPPVSRQELEELATFCSVRFRGFRYIRFHDDEKGRAASKFRASCVEQCARYVKADFGCPPLTNVPERMDLFVNLEVLHICHHRLSELPSSVARLVKLRELCLAGNRTTERKDFYYEKKVVQESVLSEWGGSSRKTSYRFVPLDREPRPYESVMQEWRMVFKGCLTKLPDLSSLTRLEKLNLSENCWEKDRLPDWLGSLKSLKELNVRNCQLQELPDLSGTQLETLYVDGNPLDEYKWNQLVEISTLKVLSAAETTPFAPPAELVEAGISVETNKPLLFAHQASLVKKRLCVKIALNM